MRGNVVNKNDSPVNIRFIAKTSDMRNFSDNIRSDVKTSEVATLCTTSLTGEQRHMHYNIVCDVINRTVFIMPSQWMI